MQSVEYLQVRRMQLSAEPPSGPHRSTGPARTGAVTTWGCTKAVNRIYPLRPARYGQDQGSLYEGEASCASAHTRRVRMVASDGTRVEPVLLDSDLRENEPRK